MPAPHVTVTEGFRWEASVIGNQEHPRIKVEVFDLEAESYACRHGAPPHEQRDDARQFTGELDTEEFAQFLRWAIAVNCSLERARSHGRLAPLIQRVAEQSSTLGGSAPPQWVPVPPLTDDDYLAALRPVPREELQRIVDAGQDQLAEDDQAA